MIAKHAQLGMTVMNYPRVDGSTSTWPMERLVACDLLGVGYRWKSIYASQEFGPFYPGYSPNPEQVPGYFVSPIHLVAKTDGNRRKARAGKIINGLLAVHHGTHQSYVNLVNGKADFILVASRPSKAEANLAKKMGVGLEFETVAKDAFVFLVSRANPVKSLALKQIRQIYSAKPGTLNWKRFGGKDEKLAALQRNETSGSQQLMMSQVMNGRKMTKNPRDLIGWSMSGPYRQMRGRPGAIAYSVFYYEQFMVVSPYVKLLGVGGVAPSHKTIANGRYPLTTKVWAVVRRDSPRRAKRIFKWMLSKQGQEVVAASGYVAVR